MIEQSETSAFTHKFILGRESAYTLLLLHGTGGDETDMIPIGRALAPAASMLSLRGPVLEGGQARFFRPMTPTGFDVKDIVARTHQLADFLKLASGAYGFDATKVIPVGYSNGANIAASMILIRPEHVPAAVLFRPMVTFEPEGLSDLSETSIFISAGSLDPLVPEQNCHELASLFKTAGARVTVSVESAGHGLTKQGVDAARDWLLARGSRVVLRTGLYADPACKEHLTGPGHPERPGRFGAVMAGIEGLGLSLAPIASRRATPRELSLCHAPEYIALAEKEIRAGLPQLSTGDTAISDGSWDAALLAAGGALQAVDAVMDGSVANAFCAVRPPGHHATPDRGMGFCVFNNAALAARHAQAAHGVGRVLIVDWDVHHGNGTQDIFYRDGSVFFFSTHQSPCYPGTGAARETGEHEGRGTTLNCPFPPGAGRAEILGAFEQKLVPAADAFGPGLVVISAGFDSRGGDPLGDFRLTDADFSDLTRCVLGIARRHAQGRVVSLLEGGYSLDGLSKAAAAHVRALAEPAPCSPS